MKKEIDIWQFVRIMVESETNPDGKILLEEFGGEWAEVDKKLAELAESDIEQYADMMMHQNIVLNLNSEINDCLISMISSVIEKLTVSLEQINDDELDKDGNMAQDLAFEIQSLEQLVDEFAN